MHQFSIGETVTCIPDRYAAPGDYKIIAVMPDRDGNQMYRIKSPLEEYERVVGESLLVKSEGKCSEEIPKNRSRRRLITLPKVRECEDESRPRAKGLLLFWFEYLRSQEQVRALGR